MVRTLLLVLAVLLAVVCGVGAVYLTAQITAGEQRLVLAEERLAAGRAALAKGRERLAAGKKELAAGKEEYAEASDNGFLVLMDKLFQGGKGFKKGRKDIAAGERQVAAGQSAVDVGVGEIEAGALRIAQGRELLALARDVRIACLIGAVLFAVLSLVLGVLWRRSVARLFRRKGA